MDKIRVSAAGAVREVVLARGEKRNALDAEMLGALTQAFAVAPPGDERVTVIRAEGSVFCAGLDLRERGGGTVGSSAIETMLHAIELYPLPVVAVVQGDAIAGGNELALHCDFVVASETARFGMSLAKIGLAPTWFLAKKLLEVAGPVGAREMLLLGDLLPARRMAELGLIHRAVPAQDLETAARTVINRLAGNAPLSLKAMKALLVRAMAFRDGIPHDDIDALVAAAGRSADAREGIAAMLERRTPRFGGR
ncbi:enoyl-CoA hydratase/isomerase family protein [Phenylobacterium sp.]|uniref:enoyl-CoA hydratase/isomerase family protein n=1 Tax=Phenylobacterium sp. TaxID=1871053 RepID=UPI002CF70ADB|nr:enoyl-CoA hydratase/isomerase family protein [Phenylobacterium sp.]HLZ75464.1 enoyl-CoA hydratase/isomerase family protein [Phenylobacterium sp.]